MRCCFFDGVFFYLPAAHDPRTTYMGCSEQGSAGNCGACIQCWHSLCAHDYHPIDQQAEEPFTKNYRVQSIPNIVAVVTSSLVSPARRCSMAFARSMIVAELDGRDAG